MDIYLPYIKKLELDEGIPYKIGYILNEKAYILTRYTGSVSSIEYIFHKNNELYSEYQDSEPYDEFLLTATEDVKKELKIQLLLQLGSVKITNNLVFVKKIIPSYLKYSNIYLWATHKIILIPSTVETYLDLSPITITVKKYTELIQIDPYEDDIYPKLSKYVEDRYEQEKNDNILNNVEHLRRYLLNNEQLEDDVNENTPIESIRLLGQKDIFLKSILNYPTLLEEYIKWGKIPGNLEDYCDNIPEESIKLLRDLPYTLITKSESCLKTIKILSIPIEDSDFILAIKNKWSIDNLKQLSSNLNISNIFKIYLSEDKISLDIIDVFFKLGLVITEDMIDIVENKKNRISILEKFKDNNYNFSWEQILDLAKENNNDNLVFIGKLLKNRSKEEIKSKIKEVLESDNYSKGVIALNLSKFDLERDLEIANMFLNSDAYSDYVVEYIKVYPKNYFLKSILNLEIIDDTKSKNLEIIEKMNMDITKEDLILSIKNSLDDKYIRYMADRIKMSNQELEFLKKMD